MVTSRSTRALTSSTLDAIEKLDIGPTFFGCWITQVDPDALARVSTRTAFENRLQVGIRVIVHDTSPSSWS